MNEEKDDFLREIDELLGGIEDEPGPLNVPLANGSTQDKGMEDFDPDLEDTLRVLSVQENYHQATPKTG